MSWSKGGARPAEVPAVLEAVGAVASRIDSRGINEEATLSVKSYGAAFDRFRVRLPPDAVLVPGAATAYTVVPVEPGDPAAPRQRRLVEVRLAKKTSGPVEVHLAANRACDPAQAGQWFDLAGFEVVGAARQWGSIAVTAAGDWQVLWGPSRGVRQVDQLPELLRRKDVAAGFDYFTQPCSLTARLVAKKTRINVEPEYVLLVDADQVRLEAKLKYTVRGAKTFALEVALPGWDAGRSGTGEPGGRRRRGGRGRGDCIPFPCCNRRRGNSRCASVRIGSIPPGATSLSRDAAAAAGQRPGVGDPRGAAGRQRGADSRQQGDGGPGPAARGRPAGASAASTGAAVLSQRARASAVFAADIRRHAQRISVDASGQVMLEEQGVRVEQKLAYLVSYEPVDHFLIEVPRSLAGSGRLELFHDGRPVSAVALPESGDNPAAPVRMRIALPKACIGLCRLTARYRLALQKPAGRRSHAC